MYALRSPVKCEYCGQYGEQCSECKHCGATIGESKAIKEVDKRWGGNVAYIVNYGRMVYASSDPGDFYETST